MLEINPWIALAAFVATGLLILGILWPTAANGERLLKKWGVAEPTAAQAQEGLLYLRRRRLLYPWLYAVLWFVPKWGDDVDQIVVVVLAGTLLAELLALRPRRGARREAVLTPRGLFDFASKWVVFPYAVFVLGAAIYLVIHPRWTALAWLAASVLAVGVIIWTAVARPAGGDQAVDLALRTRSVHVAAGLGAAMVGGLVHPWVGVLGLLMWISMANTTPQPAKIAK
ncbi:hypothetical protein C8D88_101606 [Lentzea atacamensis]|uniref:Uncharacterized protein n=1 Tax=Lentzea atacamensis TaxID=531938 RepID=A0A316IJT3_9PSEU|nr:hypothetical protein [Lentzea atacamensis]PWK90588.1 hypothetical protein C8D88_101606 [Lentzea atacamensis]